MIESLGSVGDQKSFYFLISELNKTKGPLIWPIIESIYLLKEKYNLDVPFDEKMKNSILDTIEEADSKYRKAAIKLIVAFEGEDITNAYIKVYGEDNETDKLIKPKLLENPKRFFEIFIGLLDNDCKNLKNLLELSLEIMSNDELGYKDFVTELQIINLTDSLIDFLDNPDEEVRKLAMELLFIIDTDKALLFIDKMLNDNNLWNKLKLLEILSNVHNEIAENAIVKLTEDKEEMISDRAKFVLEQNSYDQPE